MDTNDNDKYVDGRRAILQALDRILAEDTSIQTIGQAFRDLIKEAPIGFFKGIVMPLFSKSHIEGTKVGDAATLPEIEIKPVEGIAYSPESEKGE